MKYPRSAKHIIMIFGLMMMLFALTPGISPSVMAADDDPAGNPAESALHISAALADTPLSAGAMGRVTLTIRIDDGWSISTAGMPAAVLQIDPPKAITLAGDVLTGQRELSRNEFLHAPFERTAGPGDTTIDFTVTEAPSEDGRIGLNIIAYMRKGEEEQAWFVRRRIELPLTPGASSRVADAANTTWGDDRSGMQIGDKAQRFTLPRADGSKVQLADHIGRHNVIVTTYRAFW